MKKSISREDRTWPAYLFGGRLRTSTLALIVAFVACWWLYETYEPSAEPASQVPASEVVPPGFIPDPAYTWAPRTDFQRQTPTTTTTTEPTTPTTTEPTAPTTTTPGEEPPGSTTPAEPTSPSAPAPSTTTSPPPVPPSLPPPPPGSPTGRG